MLVFFIVWKDYEFKIGLRLRKSKRIDWLEKWIKWM